MTPYRPDLNTDAYSLDWLTARAAALSKVLTGSNKNQRQSPAALAELAAIKYAIRHRPAEARPVPTPPAPPEARHTGPYSQELRKARRDYAPKLHSVCA